MNNPRITGVRVTGEWHRGISEVGIFSEMRVTFSPTESMDLKNVMTFRTHEGRTITVLDATKNVEAIETTGPGQ